MRSKVRAAFLPEASKTSRSISEAKRISRAGDIVRYSGRFMS